MRDAPAHARDGGRLSRRTLISHTVIAGLSLGAVGRLTERWSTAAELSKFKTVTPGVITVAMNGDMPMTSVRDGKLIGTDGEMIATIAKQLGLGVNPSLMDWSATIESVKTGRTDIMLGNMGWTKVRTEVLCCTDAIYYPIRVVLMKQSWTLASVSLADFNGHSVGTVTGFTYVPELKRVPGVKEVRLYDTTDACVRDVTAGRLDFALLDAPVVSYLVAQNPGWQLKIVPLSSPPDPNYPILTSGKSVTVMGMSMQNPDLFDAVNAGVKWLWKTGLNARILAKYGVSNPLFLVPPATNPRIGVDRDEKGNIIGPCAHAAKDFSSLFK